MKNKMVKVLVVVGLTFFAACSKSNKVSITGDVEKPIQTEDVKNKPHHFGGWYCPDNLNGFPAVDIADWKNVPVINGRMSTKDEAETQASLIYVDPAEYPNAKAMDVKMPQLAMFYNQDTRRDEFIIVIQAFTVGEDSIVGFRYLNGGNGSARVSDVRFPIDSEIEKISNSRFVSLDISINATQDEIWQILTNVEYAEKLKTTFDKDNLQKADWRESTNVNFFYQNKGLVHALFANKIFGCYYVQNDCGNLNYTEKFLLLENPETKITELKIVCGPYRDDFETQKSILTNWAQKVKELSEIGK